MSGTLRFRQARPKARDDAKQVPRGEGLAEQGSSLMLPWQLLSSIPAHKGEGDPPCEQRVGDAAHRLSAKIGIEQSTIHPFML